MSEKLKPCPFYGGEARTIGYPQGNEVFVECRSCGIMTGAKLSREQVILEWNRRAQQPNEPLTVDELRKMDGGPVWCTWINGWALIYIGGNSELEFVYHDGSYHTFDELKHLLHECKLPFTAYRRPPEEGEKE